MGGHSSPGAPEAALSDPASPWRRKDEQRTGPGELARAGVTHMDRWRTAPGSWRPAKGNTDLAGELLAARADRLAQRSDRPFVRRSVCHSCRIASTSRSSAVCSLVGETMRQRFGVGASRLRRVGLLAVAIAACLGPPRVGDMGDSSGSDPCGGGTCGFTDHKYFSVYYCPIAGGSIGLSWRLPDDCLRQCDSAAASGCDASGCSEGCAVDHGTGAWTPCTSAPTGGEVTQSGCFLRGSGLNGETIPCDCR